MTYLIIALIGVVGGLVSGLFGVGGGILFVPLLILLASFNPHVAIGTSLAVIVPTALIGAFRHSLAGMIEWKTFLILALFAILGAWVGSELSLKLGTAVLRRLYAVFLLAVALKLFFQK
ncbi:MAG TPA: sulfite exporter TauE/SafE family protein [bacterium]|nr:sulfite exporter TauE/SafE family protein [bacterium]